jgi:membrane fusion protein (multidrug efflux system)
MNVSTKRSTMPDDGGFRVAARARARAFAARFGRRGIAIAAVTLVVVVIAMAGVHWLTVGRYMVSTDNAYVRADISQISAKVEGYVRAVPALENQSVHAGDVLVEIDPTDYEARVAQLRAALAQAEGQRASQQAARAWAASEVDRYRPLARSGILSSARMQQIEIENRQAGAGLEAADAAVAAAQAALDAAQLDLERTTIHAPIDGVVGDRQAQVGQLVRSGSPLMSVVPLQAIYVIANFKETQIARFHEGQRVIIDPDVADVHLTGALESLAPASGSQFSIIPTDTATGNFTKIVQRVPVRIRIDPDQTGIELLRPGLSTAVTVDTRE